MNREKMLLSATYGKSNTMTEFSPAPPIGVPPHTTVSAKLPDDLFTFIENWRWDNRLTKSQVVVDALEEWAKSKGFKKTTPLEDLPLVEGTSS